MRLWPGRSPKRVSAAPRRAVLSQRRADKMLMRTCFGQHMFHNTDSSLFKNPPRFIFSGESLMAIDVNLTKLYGTHDKHGPSYQASHAKSYQSILTSQPYIHDMYTWNVLVRLSHVCVIVWIMRAGRGGCEVSCPPRCKLTLPGLTQGSIRCDIIDEDITRFTRSCAVAELPTHAIRMRKRSTSNCKF